MQVAGQGGLGSIVPCKPRRHPVAHGTCFDRIARGAGIAREIAIASAKAMYRRFRDVFGGEGFVSLRQPGARVQRPLWARTGTKNPACSEVTCVEELIGPDTVNPDTLAAFRSHGRVRGDTVLEKEPEAERQLRALWDWGVDPDAITDQLQVHGVASFASAY